MTVPHVVVIGGNFAGLTAARFVRGAVGHAVDITVVEPRDSLIFVPNIGLEILDDRDPAKSLRLPLGRILRRDDSTLVNATATAIDVDRRTVSILPSGRPGAASEEISYDYLIIAAGARLAYDKIEGFGAHGHTVSDFHYGNRLRKYLFADDGYRGGPIAIGSARFNQGLQGKPDWLPVADSACDGPVLELSLSLASWLTERDMGGADKVTFFSASEPVAEDVGPEIVDQFLGMAAEQGFHYQRDTPDVERITAGGIEFTNGTSVEAEISIVLPDWQPHEFLRELAITDEVGFVLTDRTMRNPDHPEIFAVGDAAALTIPKIGGIGHMQAEIVANEIARDLGRADDAVAFEPAVMCFGDMGNHKAFYIHSDIWFGGETSVFKMGYSFYAMKIAFKEMYFRTGGKVPGWGMPATEFMADRVL